MPNRSRTVAGPGYYAVGEVSRATNIPVETLRIWERRYGSPQPIRLPSGHRRYTDEHVRRLRRVAEALARGHRPGRLLRMDDSELDQLLASSEPTDATDPLVASWVELVEQSRFEELESVLASRTDTLDPLGCLQREIAPLLVGIGRAWADGRIDVHQEHFATQRMEDALRAWRQRLGRPGDEAPRVLLATLPGESHALGLQMVGVLCAASGVEARLLGPDAPIETIVSAAVEQEVSAVALSVSLYSGGVSSDEALVELRARLPASIELVVGGRGARRGRRGRQGVRYLDGLEDAWNWLGELG